MGRVLPPTLVKVPTQPHCGPVGGKRIDLGAGLEVQAKSLPVVALKAASPHCQPNFA
jgi:hypothetical protein